MFFGVLASAIYRVWRERFIFGNIETSETAQQRSDRLNKIKSFHNIKDTKTQVHLPHRIDKDTQVIIDTAS